MSTVPEERSLENVAARLVELEQECANLQHENNCMRTEIAELRKGQPAVSSAPEEVLYGQESTQADNYRLHSKQANIIKRSSRRGMLRKVVGATIAAIGAGALFQSQADSVHADGNEGPTVFTGTDTQPAVIATGVGDQDAIDANASTGYAINAFSSSGTAILAQGGGTSPALNAFSNAGTAIKAVSNTTTGVYSQSTSGAGVVSITKSGVGVFAASTNGTGVVAKSHNAVALQVVGLLQVQGNAVGQAVLPAGKTSVKVNTPAATPTSNIMLTPLGNPGGQLWVILGNGSFTIQVSSPPQNNVVIKYFIIN